MVIRRIERILYAVDDVSESARFFADLGLSPRHVAADGAEFATQTGQVVRLRLTTDPAVPPGLEPGPTLREVVWGTDDQRALDRLADDLRRDREVTVDGNGDVHTTDETGYGLGFTVAAPVEAPRAGEASNTYGHVARWNRPLSAPGLVRPMRICHLALNIPKAGRERAVAFYTGRLNFRIVDDVLPLGPFMQCEGEDDHHNLLLCHRPDRPGVNHVSFEVADLEEVVLGGNQMVDRGWREARRLGRHTLGSNFYRFFHAPCGGRIEYVADMDRIDADYRSRRFETAPPHHLWQLKTNAELALEGQ